MNIVKVRTQGNSWGITIPLTVIRQLKLLRGDYVTLSLVGKSMVLKKLELPKSTKESTERRTRHE